MLNKLIIEKLPNTKDIDGAKRWDEEKGEFVQISYREEIKHLAFFEIKRGFSRGSHYHKQKDEIFYVVQGKMKAVFMDMDTLEKEEYVLEKGHKIRIQPRLAHVFHGLEDALVVEYSSYFYDKDDGLKVEFGVLV